MPASDHLPPLAISALAVTGSGAAAVDVETRLAALGAQLAPGVAAALLDELAALGLLRVGRGTGEARRFVLTATAFGRPLWDPWVVRPRPAAPARCPTRGPRRRRRTSTRGHP